MHRYCEKYCIKRTEMKCFQFRIKKKIFGNDLQLRAGAAITTTITTTITTSTAAKPKLHQH